MALVFISKEADVNYIALSTDIVDSKIDGATMVGGVVYTTDDGTWYIIEDDLTLSEYTLPISISGGVTVGAVDQGAAGAYAIPTEISSAKFVKLWSKNTTAATETDINQGAARILKVMLK